MTKYSEAGDERDLLPKTTDAHLESLATWTEAACQREIRTSPKSCSKCQLFVWAQTGVAVFTLHKRADHGLTGRLVRTKLSRELLLFPYGLRKQQPSTCAVGAVFGADSVRPFSLRLINMNGKWHCLLD